MMLGKFPIEVIMTSLRSDNTNDASGASTPIGVFWDIENCPVPSSKSPLAVVQRIRSRFFTNHVEVEFLCVCDARKENAWLTQELNDAQVTVVHVNATSKNAADDKLRQCLRRFANAYSPPATLILISGDVNFASDLSDMRHRQKFHVIVLHPDQSAAGALLACAHEAFSFTELVADVSSRVAKKKTVQNEHEILVRDLPSYRPMALLKTRLRQLSDNCGGKVVNMSKTTALLKFPSAEDAAKALKRLKGEDVFGRTIHVELVSGLQRVPGFKPQHQVVKQLVEKRDGTKDHVADKTSRCKSLGPDDRCKTKESQTPVSSKRSKSLENTQNGPVSQNEDRPCAKSLGPDDRCKTEACKTPVSSKRSTSLENTQKEPVSQNEDRPCALSQPQHLESPEGSAVSKKLEDQSPVGKATPKRDGSPKGVLNPRQSSLNRSYRASSTDSRSSTPGVVKPKCKRRRDRQKAKKANGKKKEGPEAVLKVPPGTQSHPTPDETASNGKLDMKKGTTAKEKPHVIIAQRKRKRKRSQTQEKRKEEELLEQLVVLASEPSRPHSADPLVARQRSGSMYSTSPRSFGTMASPQSFRTSPRAHFSPPQQQYYYGYNQKVYSDPSLSMYPAPQEQQQQQQAQQDGNDMCCYPDPFSRAPPQRSVAFQGDYFPRGVGGGGGGGGGYTTPTPRRCGTSPRGSYGGGGVSAGGGISPKFRRTPGAHRPNSCVAGFSMYDGTGSAGVGSAVPVQGSARHGGTGGVGGVMQSQHGGSGRNTPAYQSRSSSSCSNNPPPVQQYFQPIRPPPSPVLPPELRSGSDMDGTGDMEEDIELMVSNLDYNISAREWKKILFTEFQQQIQVQGVYIQTQADNTNIGFVRVASIDEARYAISQFHRKKIGYKRIHVALVNHDAGMACNNTKVEVQALLREVTGHRLPLFKFIELFEKRYHRSISVSELYRLRDVVDIQGDSGDAGGPGGGRMVLLTTPGPPHSASGGSGGSSPVAGIMDHQSDDGSTVPLESPVCRQHCKEGSMNYMDALDLCCLPNVVLLLTSFAPQVHSLLQLHDGCMPIMSFPACYAAEFCELKTVTSGGVPLEHMVSCVPGVQVVVSKSGIKKVQWAENKVTSQLPEFGRFCTSPLMNQQLGQFSREVVDLLKTCPQCKMTFSKFIPNYHHHFGRQCRVADYGYTKLMELFEAIPHVVQILGGGSRRFVTLSHRAQVKRFMSDILRVLKSQASKQINITDMPIIYNRVVGKPFDITDYGVCYIEDMLVELPESTIVVTGAGSQMNLAIPRREQTSEEMERTRQFSLEVVDLLKHSPQCRMPFNKFIPSYHHHFGKQCRVSDYGFTKLIELFESIPNIVQLLDEQDEKLLALTEPELVKVLEEQVAALLRAWPHQAIPITHFLPAYMKQFGHSLHLQDFGVSTLPELITKIPNTATIEAEEGVVLVRLVDHSYVEQLARRVLLILMEVDSGQMSLAELDAAHSSMFGLKLSRKELREELQGVVQVTGGTTDDASCTVKLCPLQQFARDARSLLRRHDGRLALAGFEAAYAAHYGVALSPAAYGYPSTAALLQAIPHVANIRGKGYRRMVLLCHDFQALGGKMMGLTGSPPSSLSQDASKLTSTDSGITEPSHEESGESSSIGGGGEQPLFLASRGPSPFDLLAGVPSNVPSPDLHPQPLDLMRFDPTPPPCDVLNSLSADEKLGQKTPLCKTPVSEMLQFAAQLLPTNPPMVPPSATPVDILQNHLQQGMPPQTMSYTTAFYHQYQDQYQGYHGEYSYSDVLPQQVLQQQQQQQQQQYQYEEYLNEGYIPYVTSCNTVQHEYLPQQQHQQQQMSQFGGDMGYHNHNHNSGGFYHQQMGFQSPMVPPPYPERYHGTPGTPSSANMSVLGKQMAELVLETTPSPAETATPLTVIAANLKHSPVPEENEATGGGESGGKGPVMQLEKKLNDTPSPNPPPNSTTTTTPTPTTPSMPSRILRSCASTTSIPSQMARVTASSRECLSATSLPCSPSRGWLRSGSGVGGGGAISGASIISRDATKTRSISGSTSSISGPTLLKWPSEGTTMNVTPKSPKREAIASIESGILASPSIVPSPRKSRIAAKFNIPLTETPPRSDTSSNYGSQDK